MQVDNLYVEAGSAFIWTSQFNRDLRPGWLKVNAGDNFEWMSF